MKKFILCALCALCGLTASAQAKFGHVNTQEIIQSMPEFTAAQTEIQKLAEQYEADLKSMQDELQKKADTFEKEQATLPENIKTRRNQELNDLYQRIQQTYQDNQQAMQKAQQDLSAHSADLPGQPAGHAEGSAGEDAGHHHQGARRHQGCWSGRQLCLHHGNGCRHPLHQHHAVYRCHCTGKGKTWIEVI